MQWSADIADKGIREGDFPPRGDSQLSLFGVLAFSDFGVGGKIVLLNGIAKEEGLDNRAGLVEHGLPVCIVTRLRPRLHAWRQTSVHSDLAYDNIKVVVNISGVFQEVLLPTKHKQTTRTHMNMAWQVLNRVSFRCITLVKEQ